MSRERLQKILSRAGVASRRGAEDLIRAGRVTVNGKRAGLGDKADPVADSVKVDGKRVRLPTVHRYLLLNKPRGYLTTRSDPQGRPTVYDLLPGAFARTVFPVGRLDFDSEGLLLLTDDGDLAQRVSHPSHGGSKTYAVKVRGVPDAAEIEILRRGIKLGGRLTRPARIEPMQVTGSRRASNNSWWRVVLQEGRTRQIREMFFRIDHPVQRLRRIAIGALTDDRLRLGRFRELEAGELALLTSSPTRARTRGS